MVQAFRQCFCVFVRGSTEKSTVKLAETPSYCLQHPQHQHATSLPPERWDITCYYITGTVLKHFSGKQTIYRAPRSSPLKVYLCGQQAAPCSTQLLCIQPSRDHAVWVCWMVIIGQWSSHGCSLLTRMSTFISGCAAVKGGLSVLLHTHYQPPRFFATYCWWYSSASVQTLTGSTVVAIFFP